MKKQNYNMVRILFKLSVKSHPQIGSHPFAIVTQSLYFCYIIDIAVQKGVSQNLTPQKKFGNSGLIYHISLNFLFSALKLVS